MKHFCSFSEAIRTGAALTPSGTIYTLLDRDGGTCAIGAGAIAIGLPTKTAFCADGRYEFLPSIPTVDELRQMFPYLWRPIKSPVEDREYDMLNVIADLFDVYRWTRERIADWLESEEEKIGYVTIVESKSSSPVDIEAVVV